MKEKLTRNDSLTVKKCDSDLKSKNVQQNLDVCVAAFEALLNKYRVHDEYFKNFAQHNSYSDKVDIYSEWRTWAENGIPTNWVNDAFFWINTESGNDLWSLIDKSWVLYYNSNLKK